MAARVIRPTARGFLHLDSHPTGCAASVEDLWRRVPAATGGPARRRVALVIGSSAGYGLAATVAGIARHGIDVVGVCFEKAPTARRTATAGWYRVTATAALAERAGGGRRLHQRGRFRRRHEDRRAGHDQGPVPVGSTI